MSLSIRPMRPDEADEIAALWRKCNLTVSYNDPEADIARARANPSSEILVGEEAGRIAATAMVGSEGHRGWMYYVAVDPDIQGGGHGRAMVKAAEDWLAEHGICKVMLLVRPTNTKVKAFYEKLGYAEEERSLLTLWLRGGPGTDADPAEQWTIETTVTYLEMRQQPTRPTVPAPSGLRLSLQRAENPTVSFYRYLYNSIGAPWAWVNQRLSSDAEIAATIQDENVDLYVLSVAGVPAGMVQLDRREADVVDLAYFGLMPEFISRGLGGYLLNWGIDQAWSSSPGRAAPAKVTVNTCDLDHPRALPLYQKMGFQPVRRETHRLPHPHWFGLEVPAHRR